MLVEPFFAAKDALFNPVVPFRDRAKIAEVVNPKDPIRGALNDQSGFAEVNQIEDVAWPFPQASQSKRNVPPQELAFT